MKRLFLLTILLIIGVSSQAQIAPNKYWVQFTDKNNTPYSIDRPEAFLSERSIQRREKYGIALDEKDIPVNMSYVEAVQNAGAVVLNTSKWLNGVTVETDDVSVMDAIEELPFVKKTRTLYDEPLKQAKKRDRFLYEMTGEDVVRAGDSRNHYGKASAQIELLNGVGLHEKGYQGEGVWIGVCDSGFGGVDVHNVFQNMRDENRLLGTRDFVCKNGNVYSEDYHGTACLGLMAGYVPNTYVGTAPKASYFLCRTEDVNSENVIEEYNWVSAAELMDSLGVDIISTSLGYIDFDDEQMTHVYGDFDGETCVITIGANVASSRGILCIVAAGNEGDAKFPYVGAPGDGKNVLTVGGVKSNGERASFSSIGPTSDGRIKPDVMSLAYAVNVASSKNSFYASSGTSFAAPSLAGMVACLWQSKNTAPESVIRKIVKESANNYSTPNNEYGYGIPDFLTAFELLELEKCDILDEKTPFYMYPNPSSGMVNLKVNYKGKASVFVFDGMGKMIYNCDNQSYNVSSVNSVLSNLDSGVYLVKIIGEDITYTSKLIKY